MRIKIKEYKLNNDIEIMNLTLNLIDENDKVIVNNYSPIPVDYGILTNERLIKIIVEQIKQKWIELKCNMEFTITFKDQSELILTFELINPNKPIIKNINSLMGMAATSYDVYSNYLFGFENELFYKWLHLYAKKK